MGTLPLKKFLLKAKLNTYAGAGERGEKKLPDGGKEFLYREGNFQYRDRYYGFNPFAGEEVVWENGKVIWIMNYFGRVFGSPISAKAIYSFLRQALHKVEEERPFRGPRMFQEGDFRYQDQSTGSIHEFTGTEKISYQGKVVYHLVYHGGKM